MSSTSGSGDFLPLTGGTVSGTTLPVLTVYGSGDTSPIFSVQGSSGELFSITDNLDGQLFAVNDISGLPVLEVYSDNTILMGDNISPSLNSTNFSTVTTGDNVLYSIPTSAYTGGFYDYTIVGVNTGGARAGNISSIWSGSSVDYSDISTNDINGSTTAVTMSVVISTGNTADLTATITGVESWDIKTIIRSI